MLGCHLGLLKVRDMTAILNPNQLRMSDRFFKLVRIASPQNAIVLPPQNQRWLLNF
jgi:hypothetical protein